MYRRQPLYTLNFPTAGVSLRKLGTLPKNGPTPTTSLLPSSSPLATLTQVRTPPIPMQMMLTSLASYINPTGCDKTTLRARVRYTRLRQVFPRLTTEVGGGRTLRSQIGLWSGRLTHSQSS